MERWDCAVVPRWGCVHGQLDPLAAHRPPHVKTVTEMCTTARRMSLGCGSPIQKVSQPAVKRCKSVSPAPSLLGVEAVLSWRFRNGISVGYVPSDALDLSVLESWRARDSFGGLLISDAPRDLPRTLHM